MDGGEIVRRQQCKLFQHWHDVGTVVPTPGQRWPNQHRCLNKLKGAEYPPSPQIALQWRHNGRDGVSNHQPHDCLLNRLFRHGSKKTSKIRITGLCAGNSSVTGEFPTQSASKAEYVSIWWCHYVMRTNRMSDRQTILSLYSNIQLEDYETVSLSIFMSSCVGVFVSKLIPKLIMKYYKMCTGTNFSEIKIKLSKFLSRKWIQKCRRQELAILLEPQHNWFSVA